jgi:excisionase family DNA binding protein
MEQGRHPEKAMESVGGRLLSIEQAARFLGISVATLYDLKARGEITSVRIRGRRLFDPADLERFIDAHREGASPPAA